MFNPKHYLSTLIELGVLNIFQFARTKRPGAMLPNRTVLLISQKKTVKSFVAYARQNT